MTRFSSKTHHMVAAVDFDPDKPAERINDFLLMSRGVSNCYAITSPTGDVVVNTGTVFEGKRVRERFEQLIGRPLDVKAIVLTQNHGDHAGGWGFFAGPETRTYGQRNFALIAADHLMLTDFFNLRRDAVLHAILGSPQLSGAQFDDSWRTAPKLAFTELFADETAFEAGGRRYELYAAPGGETINNLFVWLPAEKTAFIGNWAGALYGALPNFYTLRGDRDRSIQQFLRDLDLLIGLEPELLVTGHDEPIHGAKRIRADLEKQRKVVTHLHDETVKGMNAGKSMWELMRDVTVPEGITMAPGRSPASYIVRAVWEEYTGWFRHELTSELYATNPASIWPELSRLAGGPAALAAKAKESLAAGDPETALHWIEIALAGAPSDPTVRNTEIAILDALIERNANQHLDEICWLETQIRLAREALGQDA